MKLIAKQKAKNNTKLILSKQKAGKQNEVEVNLQKRKNGKKLIDSPTNKRDEVFSDLINLIC